MFWVSWVITLVGCYFSNSKFLKQDTKKKALVLSDIKDRKKVQVISVEGNPENDNQNYFESSVWIEGEEGNFTMSLCNNDFSVRLMTGSYIKIGSMLYPIQQ